MKIVEEQGGFRTGRGCADQVFTLHQLIYHKKRAGRRLYTCFIDITKAYDTVWREGLWVKLHAAGVRGRMWNVLRNMYETVQSKIQLNEECTTDYFRIHARFETRMCAVADPVQFLSQ